MLQRLGLEIPSSLSSWRNFSHSWLHCRSEETILSPAGTPRELAPRGAEPTQRKFIFHGPVLPRLFVVEELVDEQFFSEASLAVSHLVYDGLTFLTRAPETTLIFHKRDLHKYCYTLHTMRT